MNATNKRIINLFLVGIILSSLAFSPLILDLTLVPRFVALSTCMLIASFCFLKQKNQFQISFDFILLAYFGYTCFVCLSILWSHTKSEAIFEASKQALCFLTFMLTVFSLKKNKTYFIENLLKFSNVLFLILLVVSTFQFAKIYPWNKDLLYTVTGLNGHKNLFASFLFLNLFFLLTGCLQLKKTWRAVSIISAVLTTFLLFLLQTKAVWLGTAVLLILFLILFLVRFKFKRHFSKTSVVTLIAFAVIVVNLFFFSILQPLIQKSSHIVDEKSETNIVQTTNLHLEQERLILWDKTYQLISKKKVFGCGIGNWQVNLPDATLKDLWRAEELNYTFQRPHNDFLWIISELGIVGLNLFLFFLTSILLLLLKVLFTGEENKKSRLEISLRIAFICGFYTVSFFDFPKERMEHNVWITLILAISYFKILENSKLKVFLSFKLTRLGGLFLILISFFLTITGMLRFKGEFKTRQMFDYKNSDQKLKLIEAGAQAQSFAYSIDPTSVPILWYTGNAYALLGNYKKAQQDFIRAHELTPFNRNVLNDLASSYVFSNNISLAKKYYEEATRISPRFDDPKLNLASIYINAQDYETAEFWLNSLMHNSERRSKYEKIVGLMKQP